MIDKTVNKILDIKYLETIVNSFSEAAKYMIFIGFVYFVSGLITPLNSVGTFIKEGYSIILLLLFTYIGYLLLDDVKKSERYGVLIVSILSFIIIFPEFSSVNFIFFVLWIKILTEVHKLISKISLSFLDELPPVIGDQIKEYIRLLILIVIVFSGAYLISVTLLSALLMIQDWVYKILNFIPVYIFFIFLMQVLWSKGLHGDQTIGRLIDALVIMMIWINFENLVLEREILYTVNASFHLVFGLGTGSGMTGMLLLALKIFKKQDVKAISQGSLFSVNEPVIWGLPIADNKEYRIPFILAPLLSISFAWFMTSIGFAKVLAYPVFFATPPLLKSFLASGGHLPTVLVELISYLIVFAVYTLFIFLNKKKGEVIDEEII